MKIPQVQVPKVFSLPPPTVVADIRVMSPNGSTKFQVRQAGQTVVESDIPVFKANLRVGLDTVVLSDHMVEYRPGKKHEVFYPVPATVTIKGLGRPSLTQILHTSVPLAPMPIEELVAEAEALYGFRVVSFIPDGQENPVVILVPVGSSINDRNTMVVGVHVTPPMLADHLLNPHKRGANPPWWKLLSMSLPPDDRAFKQVITSAMRQMPGNALWMNFHDELLRHFAVGPKDRGRALVITGPAGLSLNPKSSSSALAGATPLTPGEWANLTYSFLTCGPATQGENPLPAPILGALPDLRFRESDYTHGGKHIAIWRVYPASKEEWEGLFSLDIHVFVEQENTSSPEIWTSALVIASGTEYDITNTESDLPARHERIYGVEGQDPDNLRRILYGMIPGSPWKIGQTPIQRRYSNGKLVRMAEKAWDWLLGFVSSPVTAYQAKRFAVRNWQEILKVIADSTEAVGVAGGAWPLGRHPVTNRLVSWDKTPAALFLGPTGSGKTVAAVVSAYMRTKNVIVLHVSDPREPWTTSLALKFGGQAPVYTFGNPETPEEFNRMATQLRKEVEGSTAMLIEQIEKSGRLLGFPWVIRRQSGNQFLYLEYLRLILEITIPAIGKLAQDFGEEMVVIVDDMVAASEAEKDTIIGDEATVVTRNFRRIFNIAMDTCRKHNTALFGIFHSFASVVENFGQAILKEFPVGLVFSDEPNRKHRLAEIFYPPNVVPQNLWEVEPPPGYETYEQKIQEEDLPDDEKRQKPGKPSGWRGWFNPHLDRKILDMLGVPK